MGDSINYMQRVGACSCIRCNFKTDAAKSFGEQDDDMLNHLALYHPHWEGDRATSLDTCPKCGAKIMEHEARMGAPGSLVCPIQLPKPSES